MYVSFLDIHEVYCEIDMYAIGWIIKEIAKNFFRIFSWKSKL